MSSGNKYADAYTEEVKKVIADAEERLQGAEILAQKLNAAGQSTLDINSEIAKLKQQIAKLKVAFP